MNNMSQSHKSTCQSCGKNVTIRKSKKGNLIQYDDIKNNKQHYCGSKSNGVISKTNPKPEKKKSKSTDKTSDNGKNIRICGYCSSEFFWHKLGNGKWIPIEEDGEIHQCKEYIKHKSPKCYNCERPIKFIQNSSGKWQPFEIDGKAHNCANFIRKN